MLTVTVYHNTDARFMPYQDGHHLVAVTSHRLPADAAQDPQAAADWAFHAFNADLDQLEAGRDTIGGEIAFLAACVYRLLGHRSLSIGDVINVHDGDSDRWLACEPSGWRSINPPSTVGGMPATAATVYERLRSQRSGTEPGHGLLGKEEVSEVPNLPADEIPDAVDKPGLLPATTAAPTLDDPGEAADRVERVTLPHSGLHVPAAFWELRVSSYRSLDTRDGQAFNATLRLGPDAVGTIRNTGVGGSSSYDPDVPSRFGYRELRAFVAACRTGSGRRPSEDEVLDALVEEYQGTRRVNQATRAGLSALRLLVPLGDGYYTPAVATAEPIHNNADRAELARQLAAATPADDGGRWQIWTGDRWDDLVATPARPAEPE